MRLYMQTPSHRPQGSWASLDFGIWGSPETSRQGYWGMALIRYLMVACVSWGFACLAWNYPHFAPLCSETLCVDSREEEKKYPLSFPGCHSPQLWVDSKVKLRGMAESVLSQWRRPFGFLLGSESRGLLLLCGEISDTEMLKTQPRQNQPWKEACQGLTPNPAFPDLRSSPIPTAAATPCCEPTQCPSNKWPPWLL